MIVNDKDAIVCGDLLRFSLQRGLKVIIVGRDVDMKSKSMKEIVASGQFEIIKQMIADDFSEKFHLENAISRHIPVGKGPRGKWGGLK